MITTRPRPQPRAGSPPLVTVVDGSAKRTLASAKAVGATSFTLSAAPGWTASAAVPLSLTLIQQASYGDPATEVSTEYYITAISGAVCTVGGVLSGTDRAYAVGDFCESRVSAATVNGAPGILAYGGSTAGQVLTSTGAATVPTWQAPTGGGGGGTATPAGGLAMLPAGVLVDGTPYTNSTAITDLSAGGTTILGTFELPGGMAAAGTVIRLRAGGPFNATASAGCGLRIYLDSAGGTIVLNPAAGAPMLPVVTGGQWSLEAFLVIRAAGAAGLVTGWGNVRSAYTSGGTGDVTYSLKTPTVNTPAAIDTTAARRFVVAGAWNGASAGNSIAMSELAWWVAGPAAVQFYGTGGTPVTNSTTSTALNTGMTTVLGSPAIAAGRAAAGTVVHVRAAGVYTGNGTDLLGLRIYLGGTAGTMVLVPASGMPAAPSGGPFPWSLEATLFFRSGGATAAVAGFGAVRLAPAVTGGLVDITTSLRNPTAGTPVPVDATAALTVDVAANWSAAATTASIQMTDFVWWFQ